MSNRKIITTGSTWEKESGSAKAVRVGNIIEVGGTTAVEKNKVMGQGNMYDQTLYILERIGRILQEAGSSLDHVVRTRFYITDLNLWEEAGRAHGEIFKNIKPANTILEVPRLIRPDLLIEVEATAIIPE